MRRFEQLLDFVRRQRPREQKSLAVSASHSLQEAQLLLGLNSFRDHVHAQRPGQIEYGLDDLKRLLTHIHALHAGRGRSVHRAAIPRIPALFSSETRAGRAEYRR